MAYVTTERTSTSQILCRKVIVVASDKGKEKRRKRFFPPSLLLVLAKALEEGKMLPL